MTELAVRPAPPRRCREVSTREAAAVRAVIDADPLVAAPLAERVAAYGLAAAPDARMLTRGGPGQSLYLVTGSVLPVRGTSADHRALAGDLDRLGVGRRSVHGRREHVLALWEQLAPRWGEAREIRDRQLLLALLAAPPTGLDEPRLRVAGTEDFELVLPAAAAVYREELGSDPMAVGGGSPFRRRVAGTVARGRCHVVVEDGRVLFKADVAVRSPRCAQLQGVWVAPEARGAGLARRALGTLVRGLQTERRIPSLVVNSSNLPARRCYAAVGLAPVVEYATVLTA